MAGAVVGRSAATPEDASSTAWKDAVAVVRAGADGADEAKALVGAMTEAERRGCLDGDLPFWAGLADMGTGGYHRRPFRAARVPRLGIPGLAFSDGPRGEDPHHVGELGAALTRGVQRHVMATAEHFACNSMENARFKVHVTIDDQALHEVYLPHVKRIVHEGVAA